MDGVSFAAAVKIIPVLILLAVIALVIQRHRAARQQQEQGVIWLQAMRMLLTHIQRHRGLSSGVLSGDKTLKATLDETQQQVSRDFDHIAKVGDWVKQHPGWQSITQHWARLAGNVYGLAPARAIDQHNRLIKNILVFVDDIAGAHHLTSLGGARANIWRELLTLAEYVGQARAIGTALSASGDRLGSAGFAQARRDLQSIHAAIMATLEAPRCRNNLDAANLQSILDFLSYVDTHLLQDGPEISSREYYKAATQTLDRLYERFDEELAKVGRRLVHSDQT